MTGDSIMRPSGRNLARRTHWVSPILAQLLAVATTASLGSGRFDILVVSVVQILSQHWIAPSMSVSDAE